MFRVLDRRIINPGLLFAKAGINFVEMVFTRKGVTAIKEPVTGGWGLPGTQLGR